jgi:hypothetical protein
MEHFRLFSCGEHQDLARCLAASPSLRASTSRRAYLVDFLHHGPNGFMHNGKCTRAYVAIVGSAVVPLVVNDGDVDDCYLVSPRAHYVLYMIEEMRKIEPVWVSLPLRRLLAAVGAVVTAGGLNRQVSINNWLVTTSPLNPLTADELRTLTGNLAAAFPTHALVFRDIDPRNTSAWREFGDNKYEFIMNRPVHEWDPARIPELGHNARRQLRKDRALLSDGPFRIRAPTELSPAEAERVAAYYEALYVTKHTTLSAQFTATYFARSVASGMANVVLFDCRNTGEPVGFFTWFDDPGFEDSGFEVRARMVASLVGYDQGRSKGDYPVYRAALGYLMDLAERRKVRLFLSTGAASFKLHRGSYEWMEYEAFYVRHLPPWRRLAWRALARLINFAGTHLDSKQI